MNNTNEFVTKLHLNPFFFSFFFLKGLHCFVFCNNIVFILLFTQDTPTASRTRVRSLLCWFSTACWYQNHQTSTNSEALLDIPLLSATDNYHCVMRYLYYSQIGLFQSDKYCCHIASSQENNFCPSSRSVEI